MGGGVSFYDIFLLLEGGLAKLYLFVGLVCYIFYRLLD